MINGGGSKSGLSGDTSLVDLDIAWRERLAGAAALAPTHHAMALGLRLYAVEVGIKALICRKLGLTHLPNHCKTRDLDEIIIDTGLVSNLNNPANRRLRRNWDSLVGFSKERLNDLRYSPNTLVKISERDRILGALDHPQHGVWTWLLSRL